MRYLYLGLLTGNKETGTIPQVGEIVLIIGDEKNHAEWRKGKIVCLIKGKDDVVTGVTSQNNCKKKRIDKLNCVRV